MHYTQGQYMERVVHKTVEGGSDGHTGECVSHPKPSMFTLCGQTKCIQSPAMVPGCPVWNAGQSLMLFFVDDTFIVNS